MNNPSRRTMEIALGALFLFSLAILAYMALRMGSLAGFGDIVNATVRLDDAAGLVEDASVKVAGVEVGRVNRLEIDFDSAIGKLQIQRDAEIRSDVIARVRARSLLGEKYLELIPQSRTAPLLEDGAEITADNSGMEIEDLANVLGPKLEDLDIDALMSSLQGTLDMVKDQRDPVEEALARINRILKEVESLPLDDPTIHADIKATLSNLRRVSGELPDMVTSAEDTLAKVNSSLDSLQPTLDQVNASSADLPKLVAQAEEGITRINRILEILEPQAKRLENLDYSFVRYVFRNEGLLVRMIPRDVPEFDTGLPDISFKGNEREPEVLNALRPQMSVDPKAEGSEPLPLFGLGDEDGTGEIPAILP